MKKFALRLTSVMLAFVLLAGISCSSPYSAKAFYDPPVNFGVVSDIHYYPESFVNLNSEKYIKDAYCRSKLMGETPALLRAMLETAAVRKEQGTYAMDYLLVSGDMTFAGELTGHREVAALFRAFEARTGTQVFVINGNHDVNNYNATDYAKSDNDDPEQITSPEAFRTIYAEFGYDEADSVFVPSTGKAGMLSYSVSLPGGYRLIAIDECTYSADVTQSGLDKKEGGMYMSPELSTWVLEETQSAVERGEAVIGMSHHSFLQHFELESYVVKDDMLPNYEKYAYELADAGMHFIFTGHIHSNDTASMVAADGEMIYDIETGALASIPNTYREAAFSAGSGQNISCKLNNVDCDAACNVDVSAVTAAYGVIEKPFSENYCMPVLHGGSIENGVRNDATEYIKTNFLPGIVEEIGNFLPTGLAGLLRDKGIDLGSEAAKASPALKATLKSYNLTPQAFSQFLEAVVKQIDNQYILDTLHTQGVVAAAAQRLMHFELAKGNSATELGKLIMLGFEYHSVGDESPQSNPEIALAVEALRTREGADRLMEELLDIIINDLLFDDILPSINLDDLDILLPADVVQKLREMAGGDLKVGSILDKILNNAANRMNLFPFIQVESGRDLVKALVYTAGYKYFNADSRLKISQSLADIIDSFTNDEDPFVRGDLYATLEYEGKTVIESTSKNYRLPANIKIEKGTQTGDVVITWLTIQGIEGSDIAFNLAVGNPVITKEVHCKETTVKTFDFVFTKLEIPRILLQHTVTIAGLDTDKSYTFRIGDSEKGLMSDTSSFTIKTNGDVEGGGKGANDFWGKLLSFVTKVFEFFLSFKTILNFIT